MSLYLFDSSKTLYFCANCISVPKLSIRSIINLQTASSLALHKDPQLSLIPSLLSLNEMYENIAINTVIFSISLILFVWKATNRNSLKCEYSCKYVRHSKIDLLIRRITASFHVHRFYETLSLNLISCNFVTTLKTYLLHCEEQ